MDTNNVTLVAKKHDLPQKIAYNWVSKKINKKSITKNRSLKHFEKEKCIQKYDEQIGAIFKANEICKKIATVPGVGKQTATIIYTAFGNGIEFKNGREFSAYLGLVPKQSSTGGKQKLLGISKRGDKYIRSLLVHGARSVVMYATNKEDERSRWINALKDKKGMNKTTVAIANRNARIILLLAA